jgi:hypothetical protein
VLHLDVFKLNVHGRSGVELEREEAIGPAVFLVVVNQLGGLHAVYVMGEVKTISHNTVAVPFLLLDGLANLIGVTKSLGLLLELAIVAGQRGFLASQGKYTPKRFTITNPGVTIA